MRFTLHSAMIIADNDLRTVHLGKEGLEERPNQQQYEVDRIEEWENL